MTRDSGTITWDDPVQRFTKRDGQHIEVTLSATFTGNRATFVLRFRIEWTRPGHGYFIGANTRARLTATQVKAVTAS